MSKSEKKSIVVPIVNLEPGDVPDQNWDDFVDSINRLCFGLINIRVCFDYKGSDSACFNVYGQRLETDDEYKKRVAKEKKAAEKAAKLKIEQMGKKAKKEYREYQRLKKKFGDK